MPNDGLTLEQYWSDHVERSLRSLVVEPSPGDIEGMVEVFPDGAKGIVRARAWFNDHAFLEIAESVEIVDGQPHRLEYAYHFILGSFTDWHIRWHFAPLYDPAIRYHIDRPEQDHIPDRRRTLIECVGLCWEILAEHAEDPDQLELEFRP